MIPVYRMPSPYRPRAHGLVVAICGFVLALAIFYVEACK